MSVCVCVYECVCVCVCVCVWHLWTEGPHGDWCSPEEACPHWLRWAAHLSPPPQDGQRRGLSWVWIFPVRRVQNPQSWVFVGASCPWDPNLLNCGRSPSRSLPDMEGASLLFLTALVMLTFRLPREKMGFTVEPRFID